MDIRNNKKNNKRRILLVEDNHLNLRIMSRLLQDMDTDVVGVNSSQEAVKYAVKEKFSIIFMGTFMPETRGCKTTKNIRELSEINKGIPVIAVTSNGNNIMTKKMKDCGVNDVISKPLKEDEVEKIFQIYPVEQITSKTQLSVDLTIFNIQEFEAFYNDETLQQEILFTFIDERENDLERISKAFQSKDIEEIYNALHYMKGSFTYLKAKSILDFTQQILDLLKAEKLNDVLLLEEIFYQYYNALFKELKLYITK